MLFMAFVLNVSELYRAKATRLEFMKIRKQIQEVKKNTKEDMRQTYAQSVDLSIVSTTSSDGHLIF